MKSYTCFCFALFALGVFAPPALARHSGSASCGSRIVFDCDHHVASMGSLTSPLDCGVSTPRFKQGRIGKSRKAYGSRWRCLKGQKSIEIGLGAVLVHSPCHGRSPKGQNQRFAHSGCPNINHQLRDAIARCQGAPYEIRYASKGNEVGATRFASRAQRPSRYERVAELFQPDSEQ